MLDGAGLDGLVNNAGIVTAGPLEFLPLDMLRQQFEVNTLGVVAVTQAFLPLIRTARGRIVQIGSDSGRVTVPFLASYCGAKFALEALTSALRMELAPWKIRVSLIEAGAIATPLWQKADAMADELERQLPPQAITLYGKALRGLRVTAGKIGRGAIPPERVAEAVEHALSARRPRHRYVVGNDARLMEVVRLLPEGLRDRLIGVLGHV